ncbi:hypothetical protein OG864_06210 [Streptomyces sp. NBC_00124]|uniref:hypothetical protein n=1 Tax=Streptomyces sp. NBC_00124 TaxID=2975662 RepID=UPI002254E699|nr:hypothetical protein [Streptomyces sp. NBC_00124]MCX5358288.1 hypothetical protein [Streptomyces sp. NBC_00124]
MAAGVVLVGGGFVAANAATSSSDAKTAGVHYPADKQANGVAAVVSAANAFLNTLDSDQQAMLAALTVTALAATAWTLAARRHARHGPAETPTAACPECFDHDQRLDAHQVLVREAAVRKRVDCVADEHD